MEISKVPSLAGTHIELKQVRIAGKGGVPGASARARAVPRQTCDRSASRGRDYEISCAPGPSLPKSSTAVFHVPSGIECHRFSFRTRAADTETEEPVDTDGRGGVKRGAICLLPRTSRVLTLLPTVAAPPARLRCCRHQWGRHLPDSR